MKKGNDSKRIATASVLFILITAMAYMGGVYFLLLIGAISMAVTREIHRLLAPGDLRPGRETLMVCVAFVLAGAHAGEQYFLIALYIALTGVFVFHLALGADDISGYVRQTGTSLVVLTLIAMMTGSAVLLRNIGDPLGGGEPLWGFLKDDLGFFLIAMAFLCGAANDSVAYFGGRLVGKTKLVPNISPGKTLEGGVAGVAASAGTALLVNVVFGSPFSIALASFCGLLAGFLSVTGDLIESAIKRNCNVKDSGTMLPGHGGFFDRFDGMIFVFPAFYIIAALLR